MCIVRRMWINQPSELQPFHQHDRENVLAIYDDSMELDKIYFTKGPIVSAIPPTHVPILSPGWIDEKG